MSARKIAAGAVVGLLAGVAIGVLLAPAKGTVTRRKLGREANKVKRTAKKQYKQASKYAGDKYDDVKEFAKLKTQRAKKDLEELSEASEPLKEKLRELMKDSEDYYTEEELDKIIKKAETAIDDVSKKIEKQAKK